MPKRFSFKGGICISSVKDHTEPFAIEIFPSPEKVYIPLQQHLGPIAHPVVKRGEHVRIGQLIAEPVEQNSLSVHSSVSGEVKSIGPFPHPGGKHILAIEIENNGFDDKANIQPFDRPWQEAANQELIQKIQSCGIVDMCEDGIPTYVKLTSTSYKPIDSLIINGIESEPYLSSDKRLIIEKTEDFLTGILIIKKITGAKTAIIGIEEKQTIIMQALSSWLIDARFKEISVVNLRSKYPNGSERQLIQAITHKVIPSGGSSLDTGSFVFNVATAIAVHDAIVHGSPLYQRVVSVCGPTIKKPKNLLIRIGTPISKVLEKCDIDFKETKKIIMGGPMMGLAQTELGVPVIKTTTGLFAYNKTTPALGLHPCINCGNCVRVCPVSLIPSQIAKSIKLNKLKRAIDWNILDCIECGACSYICPAKINLMHYIRLGKYNIEIGNFMEHSQQKAIYKGSRVK